MRINLQRPCFRRLPVLSTAFALGLMALAGPTILAQMPLAHIKHLNPQEMSATDHATVQARRDEIVEGAEIYGYDLTAGNWTYRQTLCAPMPHTILLHYAERFPDGMESLFTALVPRGQGSVHIVPVLYRNATPYVPAPRNPRNYALFNSLVSQNISSQLRLSSRNWIELSACYAEMTGADIIIPKDGSVEAGVAQAPSATIHVEPQHEGSLVTFADRESGSTFRVWSISFNKKGRVTAAGTEVYPMIQSVATSQQSAVAMQSVMTESAPIHVSQLSEASVPASHPIEPQQATQPAQATTMTSNIIPMSSSTERRTSARALIQTSQGKAIDPGWKFIPQAPQPPSKFIPDAPQPPSKIIPPPSTE